VTFGKANIEKMECFFALPFPEYRDSLLSLHFSLRYRTMAPAGERALVQGPSSLPSAPPGASLRGASPQRSSASQSSPRPLSTARCRRRADIRGHHPSARVRLRSSLRSSGLDAAGTNSRAAWRASNRTSAATASGAARWLVSRNVDSPCRISTRYTGRQNKSEWPIRC
jgi:hypothetical protein